MHQNKLLLHLPQNMTMLKKIQNLSPSICLNHIMSVFDNLPLNLANQSKLSEIESQWCMLLTLKWENVFGCSTPIAGSFFLG